MESKAKTILTALVFIFLSLLLTASCAKRQVGISETGQEVTKETAAGERGAGEVQKPGEEGQAYQREEAGRQARLRELEKEQELAGEVKAFDAQKIYFEFDKSDLKPEARATLEKKADWLQKHPSYSVWIEGNCDERGTAEYNLALGERRAYAAKKFLMDLGIPENRIKTISYGEEKPADPGHTEEAWAKNRRDEFRLFK